MFLNQNLKPKERLLSMVKSCEDIQETNSSSRIPLCNLTERKIVCHF